MNTNDYRNLFKDFIFKYRISNVIKKIQEKKKYDKLLEALENPKIAENADLKELFSLRSLLMELKNDCKLVVDQIEKKNIK